MFGRSRKAAPKLQRPVNTQVLGDTLRTSEQLARHYGLNVEAIELIQHAFGEAMICARINAKVCDSATLRLYKRAGGSSAPKGTRGRKVTKSVHNAMRSGKYGRKLAEFTMGGAEMVEVESHPVLDLLSNPNWMYPGNEISYIGWLFRWVTGNSYDHVSFNGTQPTLINPFYAQYVNIVADDETGIASYVYGRAESQWTAYSPDEVVHYKLYPSMKSPLYGESPLNDVLPYVDQLKDSVILDIAMTKNGLRPDMLVRLPEGTSEPQQATFVKRLKNASRGVMRWVEPLVVTGSDVDVKQITWSEKEAMTLPKREEASKMVRRAYGHDEAQADSSDSTYAAALMGDSRYLGQTIEPALQQDAAQKSKVLKMFGLDPNEYAFAYDPMVEKDQAKLEERITSQWQAGLLTANEARVELGRDTVDDENADKLMVNGQPLGAAATSDPFGGLFANMGGSQQTETSTEDEPAPPGSGEAEAATEEKQAKPNPIDFKTILKECENPLWKYCEHCRRTKDDDDDISATPLLKEALQKFQGQVQSVALEVVTDMQNDVLEAERQRVTPNLRDNVTQAAGEFSDVFKDIMDFGVTNILENRGNILGAVEVPDEAFNIAPERALRALDEYTFELAGDLADTTIEMTQRAVRNGVENGLSIDAIAKEIEGFPEYRSEAIARTETSRAMNTGAREGMIAVGVDKHRVLTAPGVRKSHAEIAKQGAIPIDQPFVKAGQTFAGETFTKDIYAPPFGVHCRCAVVPVIGD